MGFIRDGWNKVTGETARQEAEAKRAHQERQAKLEGDRVEGLQQAAAERAVEASREAEAERARLPELRQAREKDPGPAVRLLERHVNEGLNRGTDEPIRTRDATRLEKKRTRQPGPDIGGGMRSNSRAGYTQAQLEAQEQQRQEASPTPAAEKIAEREKQRAELDPLDEAKRRLAEQKILDELEGKQPRAKDQGREMEMRPPWDDGRGGGSGRRL